MTNRISPRRSAAQVSRTKGFAIAIDYLDGRPHDARLIDKSPVLFPEKVVRSGIEESGHRRFGLVEYAGVGEPPPSGLIRHVADAFFVDARIANFAWQAIIEKIDNDASDIAAAKPENAFPGFLRKIAA